ncbi:MAG: TonB C-terminal domain-containing protein, partial [Myxococcota bacterium]|nr:TonB C-terminal domain-containing protein [Myxococcota bacterium]
PLALLAGATSTMIMAALMIALPTISAAAAKPNPKHKPFEFIEARLLKAGEIKDPDKMPDRIAPVQATAPEEVLPLDSNAQKQERDTEKKTERQREAVDDNKLRQVYDKARAFAEIQDVVPEGHPDGVPDGDVTDPRLASLGDMYGRKIMKLIQERWLVATIFSNEELKRLHAKLVLRFDVDMSISSYEISKSSGNRRFDDSILAAVETVKVEVKTLPSPPEAIAAQIFGGGIEIKMNGASAEQ